MNQAVVLALIPKFSSVLSIIGSGWIVLEVSTNPSKRKNVYHRLLLAMAIYDIFESIFNFFSTWPIPRGSPGIYGAVGTTATCVIQGFFLQLGLAIPIYNAGLSIYYLLVLRYGYTDKSVEKVVEPLMHGFAFSFPFGTALTAVILNLFNNANLWCWIAPYPMDCLDSRRYGKENSTCVRGDNAWIYRWAFYFVPLWTCILVAMFTMIAVYWTVLEKELATVRKTNINNGDTSFDDFMSGYSSTWDLKRQSQESIGTHQEEETMTSVSVSTSVMASGEASGSNKKKAASTRQMIRSASESSTGGRMASDDDTAFSARENDDGPLFGLGGMIGTVVSSRSLNKTKRTRGPRQGYLNRGTRRSQQVLGQGLFYLTAFYMTHLFSTINRTLQLIIGHTFFPLLVMHAIFDPLQGFLNFLVYRRPVYMRNRKIDPDMSRIHAWIKAFEFSDRPGEVRSSRYSAVTRGMSPTEAAAFRLALTQEKGRTVQRPQATPEKSKSSLAIKKTTTVCSKDVPKTTEKKETLTETAANTTESMPSDLLEDNEDDN